MDEFESIFRQLSAELNILVLIGDPEQHDLDVVGSPPSSASLCRDCAGALTVVSHSLSDAVDVEVALHELAHAVVGISDEWACYEKAAVWALRFPPTVSTVVAEMAAEARS